MDIYQRLKNARESVNVSLILPNDTNHITTIHVFFGNNNRKDNFYHNITQNDDILII